MHGEELLVLEALVERCILSFERKRVIIMARMMMIEQMNLDESNEKSTEGNDWDEAD